MKLLLDENLPRKLKAAFGSDHEIFTVGDMGWNGMKNGALLGMMVMESFEGFVTMDKNLRHQQNLDKFPILLIVLDAPDNKIETLEPYAARMLTLLAEKVSENILTVSI